LRGMEPSAPDWVKPPAYEAVYTPPTQTKLEALRRVAEQYEMAGGAIAKLRQLEGYDIVLICDDSSSMAQPAHDPNPSRPYDKVLSRWEELKHRAIQIMAIACCLDQDGIDIYFLNRPPAFNVNDVASAEALFASPPHGYTPLSATYARVLHDKLRNKEGRVLIIVATDGEPNRQIGGTWVKDLTGFENLLTNREGYPSHRCPTTIMACTDSEYEIGWLNRLDLGLDGSVQHCDVVDDYQSERKEIMGVQGQDFRFSQGDYVVKTLLGALVPFYDHMDERKLTRPELAEYLGVDIHTLPRQSQCQNCVML